MSDDIYTIKFWPWDDYIESITLSPVPAGKLVPEQWKEFSRYIENEPGHMTVKHCLPFFDAMTAGYSFILPVDVEIKIIEGVPQAIFDHPLRLIEVRSIKEVPPPQGYYPVHFSWQMWWGVKVPEGWSALVTHPVNHHELPFHTTSGIVDYDVFIQPGNIGFFIVDGFEGIIPKGTPMFQIIPIRRQEWSMEIDRSLSAVGRAYNENKLKITQESGWEGHYKKNVRMDKKYS
jgi:hypothetical protein